jgi:hypothetical protein
MDALGLSRRLKKAAPNWCRCLEAFLAEYIRVMRGVVCEEYQASKILPRRISLKRAASASMVLALTSAVPSAHSIGNTFHRADTSQLQLVGTN